MATTHSSLSTAALRSLALLAGLAAGPAYALSAQASIADSGARMERLADGVYAIIHDDATDNWPHGNTGVVVGDDGVLVVDATYLPSRARADIVLIRRVTDKPVRYLVNTHWHGDHTHGNGVYRDSFPGIAIVGPREARHYLELNRARWPKMATAPNSASRASLAALEARLAKGSDSAGRALSTAERGRLQSLIPRRRHELEELAKVQVAPPDLLFDGELTLTLGKRRIQLRDWGRANSPHDVTVHLPDERVMFTGDILVHPVPYAFGAWPVQWIGVLRGLEAMPVAALVPGHGRPMRDHAYTALVRELFETSLSHVNELARQGRTLQEVQRQIDLEQLRRRFVAEGDRDAQELWDGSIKAAMIESMYQCTVGYRC